jgi:alpha-2-macroglobulin
MDSAKTSPEQGTFWAPEDRSWLWYNDTTETHAFALRTLTELKPKDPRRDGLVQWLLLDKKLNHWKSTRATAEALYALVKYLEQEGALGVREDAKVTVGEKTVEFVFEPDKYTGKKNQVVVPGPEVDPVKSSTVVVQKTTPGFAFASATWQFSTEKLPTEERGDFFQVSRRYFLRVREGREAVLRPLAEGAKLAPGDEVEVQISLRTKHEAEYVHLRDPRAAGLEPEGAVSRHKWDLGIVWYEETRDSGTNFFFEWLPAGEYTFKYRLRANMAGTFRVGPATVQSMYAPEFTAYSTGAVLTVGGARP